MLDNYFGTAACPAPVNTVILLVEAEELTDVLLKYKVIQVKRIDDKFEVMYEC